MQRQMHEDPRLPA